MIALSRQDVGLGSRPTEPAVPLRDASANLLHQDHDFSHDPSELGILRRSTKAYRSSLAIALTAERRANCVRRELLCCRHSSPDGNSHNSIPERLCLLVHE